MKYKNEYSNLKVKFSESIREDFLKELNFCLKNMTFFEKEALGLNTQRFYCRHKFLSESSSSYDDIFFLISLISFISKRDISKFIKYKDFFEKILATIEKY